MNVAGRVHCQVMITMMQVAMRKKMMMVKMMGMKVLMKMKKIMVVR